MNDENENENLTVIVLLDNSNEEKEVVEKIASVNKEVINLEENENELENKVEKNGEDEEELTESEGEKIQEPEVLLKKIDFVYIKPISNENFGKVNYLFDYCVDLFKQGYYDPKIITWMIENKAPLASIGIDDNTLKWLIKQDKYYKGNNIINSMTYRLAKFGRLAPKNDLVRILNEEDNSENFKYYQEDSFLAKDEDEEVRNDFNFIKQNQIEGIFKEDDLYNLLTKLKGKKKKKKKVIEDKSLLGNKRKLSNDNIDNPTGEVIIYTSLTDFLNAQGAIKNDCSENPRVKYSVIRELIFAQRRKKKSDVNKVHIDNFEINFDQLSKFINEEETICKMLIDYETNRYKKENKWSSIYKSLHKLSKELKSKCSEFNSPEEENDLIKSNDKYKDIIRIIYNKVHAYLCIISDLGNIIKTHSGILKKFTQIQPEVDPTEYCNARIRSCFEKVQLSDNVKENFWAIYNNCDKNDPIEENNVEHLSNSNIQNEEQATIEINLKEVITPVEYSRQVENKNEIIMEEAKIESKSLLSPPSNMINNSLPNNNNEFILSSAQKSKNDKKQNIQHSNKKPKLSKVFYSKDFNDADF